MPPPIALACRTGGLLLLLPAVGIFQSVFWADEVLLAPKLAVTGLALLSAWRPRDGLLAVAALGPLGSVAADPTGIGRGVAEALAAAPRATAPATMSETLLPVVQDQTHRFPETLILAFLIGYGLRLVWRPGDHRSVPASLLAPGLLLASAVLASCIVNNRVWHAWDLAFQSGNRVVDFLVRGYHNPIGTHPSAPVDTFDSIEATVGTLAMIGVLLATFSLCRGDKDYTRRLVRMIVAGAAGAALLGFVAMAMYIVSHPEAGALRTALTQRWTLVGSINTMGPQIVLVAPLALACGCAMRSTRAVWWGAAAVLLAALWSNATRSAILPGVAAGAAALIWLVRDQPSRRLRAALMAAILLAGTGLVAGTAIRFLGNDHTYFWTLRTRLEFAQQAVPLIADKPVFGHGIDQYGRAARRQEAKTVPHNLYLSTAGELGITGVGLLLWLIGSAVWLMFKGLRARPPDALLLAACVGVTAFLVANLGRGSLGAGFTLVAGLAAALGFDRSAHPAETVHGAAPAANPSWPRGLRACTVAGIVLLAASIPWRVDREARTIDLSHLESGFDRWEAASDARFRWTRGPVEFFVHPSVTAVELPVRALGVERTGPRNVEVRINGDIEQRLLMTRDGWQNIHLVLSPSGHVWRKIDIDVSPTWIPRDVLPGSADPRELGVMTGELRRCHGPVATGGACPDGWTSGAS